MCLDITLVSVCLRWTPTTVSENIAEFPTAPELVSTAQLSVHFCPDTSQNNFLQQLEIISCEDYQNSFKNGIMSRIINIPCQCPSKLHVCNFEVGCICPIGVNCDVEIQYPEHPDFDEALKDEDNETNFRLALLLSIGGTVIAALTIYILIVAKKIKDKRKMQQDQVNDSSSSSSSQSTDLSSDTSSHSNHSVELQPITSLSTLLKLSKSKDFTSQEFLPHQLHPADHTSVLQLHPSPLLSSISMITTSSSLMSSRSISINISHDNLDDEDSEHSYDHLNHHRSINDLAPNYCQQ